MTTLASLLPVRLYTANTPYHYTEDNKPLQDLQNNDQILATAIDALSSSTDVKIVVGNWSGLQIDFDLFPDLGKPFAYKFKLWGIQDQSLLSTQSSTFREDFLIGYNAIPGNSTILQTWTEENHNVGTGTLVVNYTASGNTLSLTFSGYTGTNAYVIAKRERFGI